MLALWEILENWCHGRFRQHHLSECTCSDLLSHVSICDSFVDSHELI